jgi:ElaB/YqjD/DUF883 family membrane-anchored ribosome-binding protein
MAKNNSATYNGYSVKDASDKAGDIAQSTVSTLQASLAKTKDLLSTGYDVAQEQLKRGKKQTEKGLKKAQKNMGSAQDTIQDKVQLALPLAQGLVGAGLGLAQVVMDRNLKRANKNLEKAQRNLKRVQGSVQDSVQSSFGAAQDVLSKGTQKAGESLTKVTDNVKDLQDSFQSRLELYQRRRARAKMLFRVGLVSGVVLALLFTPWPGSETRRQLGETGQQLSQLTQKLFGRFTSK